MIFLHFLIFVSSFLFAFSVCPPPEVVRPCYCHYVEFSTINCNGTKTIDIKETLSRVSKNAKSAKDKHFWKLAIYNRNITEIPANVTGDLIFNMTDIQAPNLTRIHSQAFVNSKTQLFYVGQLNKKLESFDAPYNLFDLINSQDNAYVVHFQVPKVNRIPANAFKTFKHLRKVVFGRCVATGCRLSIGDRAFYSLDLNILDLTFNNIDFLTRDALKMKNGSDSVQFINVNLGYNELNSTSFAPGSLNGFGKKTILNLLHNRISYLDEVTFKSFFEAQDGNEIESLFGNPLNCSDCRNAWLAKEQDKYKIWVGHAHCDGQINQPTVFDQKFDHCK